MRLIKFFFLLVMLTGTAMSATASLTLSNLNNTANDGASVTIGSTTHGTVSTYKAQAGPGERVTLTATSDDGCRLVSISAKGAESLPKGMS